MLYPNSTRLIVLASTQQRGPNYKKRRGMLVSTYVLIRTHHALGGRA
jgi:hypothetical protein